MYVYNPLGLPESITDSLGNTVTMTYDTNNNPLTTTNALGHIARTSHYGPTGKIIQKNTPHNSTIQYVYDGFENVVKISQTSPKDGPILMTNRFTYTYGIGHPAGMTTQHHSMSDGIVHNVITTKYDTFGRELSQVDSTAAQTTTKYNTL